MCPAGSCRGGGASPRTRAARVQLPRGGNGRWPSQPAALRERGVAPPPDQTVRGVVRAARCEAGRAADQPGHCAVRHRRRPGRRPRQGDGCGHQAGPVAPEPGERLYGVPSPRETAPGVVDVASHRGARRADRAPDRLRAAVRRPTLPQPALGVRRPARVDLRRPGGGRPLRGRPAPRRVRLRRPAGQRPAAIPQQHALGAVPPRAPPAGPAGMPGQPRPGALHVRQRHRRVPIAGVRQHRLGVRTPARRHARTVRHVRQRGRPRLRQRRRGGIPARPTADHLERIARVCTFCTRVRTGQAGSAGGVRVEGDPVAVHRAGPVQRGLVDGVAQDLPAELPGRDRRRARIATHDPAARALADCPLEHDPLRVHARVAVRHVRQPGHAARQAPRRPRPAELPEPVPTRGRAFATFRQRRHPGGRTTTTGPPGQRIAPAPPA